MKLRFKPKPKPLPVDISNLREQLAQAHGQGDEGMVRTILDQIAYLQNPRLGKPLAAQPIIAFGSRRKLLIEKFKLTPRG